jgi:hypothetical protein
MVVLELGDCPRLGSGVSLSATKHGADAGVYIDASVSDFAENKNAIEGGQHEEIDSNVADDFPGRSGVRSVRG